MNLGAARYMCHSHNILDNQLKLTINGPSGRLKPYSTPMDSRVPYTKSQCPAPESEEATRMKSMPYRELIGTLLWVANGTRPDITYAVGTLAKFTNNPGEIHWKALLRVLGYLSQSVDFCIKYQR